MQTAEIVTKRTDFRDQRQVNSDDNVASSSSAVERLEFRGTAKCFGKENQDAVQILKNENVPTASVIENPNSSSIARIIERHGMSRLTLLGLDLNNKDANSEPPNINTITIEGVFLNQDDGYHYAVVSEIINSSFLINLDIAIEYDEAVRTRHANYLTQLKVTEVAEAQDELISLPQRQITYDPNSRSSGKMSETTIHSLCEKIAASPRNAFVPFTLSGPAASTDPFIQNPEVATVYNTPSAAGEWVAPESEEELKATLRIALGDAVDRTVNRPWITALFNETRNTQVPVGYRGLELTLHFPVAYGHVAHIAPAALWRERHASDKPGILRVAVLHQEAIPIQGPIWEGRVFSYFDTRKDLSILRTPVGESIKLTGMPNVVEVQPAKYPDKLELLASAMAGIENARPYGGDLNWHGDKGRFPDTVPFTSCSNTSYEAHEIMNGRYPIHQATLPDLWTGKIGDLYGVNRAAIATTVVNGKTYKLEDFPKLPFKEKATLWTRITIHSGHNPKVPSTYSPMQCKMPLPQSDGGTLPEDFFPKDYHGAVFINPKSLRTVDGQSVDRNVFYSQDQIQAMTLHNPDEGKSLEYWVATNSLAVTRC